MFFLMAVTCRANDVEMYGESQSVKFDTLQTLSDELSQIKLQLQEEQKKKEIDQIWKRRKYWKIGFDNSSFNRTDGEPMTWKTDYAFFLQNGRTVYFHSKPVGGRVKFGLDYGFMNMGYAKLKLKSIDVASGSPSESGAGSVNNPNGFDEIVSDDPSSSFLSLMGIDLGMQKIDYGVHLGPSVNVNPWKHLIVSAYFHVMPTASGILENESFSYGFSCGMSAGLSVSYKVISFGVEGLWSTTKYKQASFDEEDMDEDYEGEFNLFNTKNFKLKQKGPRFYFAFRF